MQDTMCHVLKVFVVRGVGTARKVLNKISIRLVPRPNGFDNAFTVFLRLYDTLIFYTNSYNLRNLLAVDI